MQTMNTDQQSFFPNPTSAAYYPPNGLDQRRIDSPVSKIELHLFLEYSMRTPGMYTGTRMPAPVTFPFEKIH